MATLKEKVVVRNSNHVTLISHVTHCPRDPDGTWARLYKAKSKDQRLWLGPRRCPGAVEAEQGQAGSMIDPDFFGVRTRDSRSRDPRLRHVRGAKA